MKVHHILENAHHYKVFEVEHLSSDHAVGTSKQGFIKVPYDDLERLFGKPKSYTHEHDTAHEWTLELHYVDPFRTDPEDVESVIVTIYDRWDHGDPSHIDEWDVGGKSREAITVLDDYLEYQKRRSKFSVVK